MPLMSQIADHVQGKELGGSSYIINANPTIWERILQDLLTVYCPKVEMLLNR
jgi:hypothetical protein